VETVEARVDGDRLTIVAPGATLGLNRLPDGDDNPMGPGVTIRHGCYDADGVFTPGELIEL
jgi:hypothetical protein